jgi:hypothetical protein
MDSYDEYGNYIGEELEDSDQEEQEEEPQFTSTTAAPSRAYDEDTNVGGDDDDVMGMEVDGESHTMLSTTRQSD